MRFTRVTLGTKIVDHALYGLLIGLLVGGLVGLTGVGSGVLLLPLLILGLHVPSLVAVGSGVALAAVTKLGATVQHWRQGNVDWRLASALASGSVPGALIGVGFLANLRSRYGAGVNHILTTLIGLLLIVIALLMLTEGRLVKRGSMTLRDRLPSWINGYHGAVLTGFVGGILVGVTAIGAGSVIMMLLLLFYRRSAAVLVGTNIFHATILAAVAGLGHFSLGTVNLRLVALLALGSIPGALLGSRLTLIVPGNWLRGILILLLIAVGAVMV